MSDKTTVIYHRSDFDGKFCREIAHHFMPDAELVGWEYGDVEPVVSPERQLYILDLSVPGLMAHPNLIWIDHHKSAIDKYPTTIPGYRIDGVAACRLAWQWFALHANWDTRELYPPHDLPSKEDFVDRRVIEPWAVRLAGEYDIWDKRDDNADLFQHGLRSEELYPNTWDALLSVNVGDEGTVARLLNQGRALQYAKTEENASIIKANGFTLEWEGLIFLACNAARYNSHLFTACIRDEHKALLGFNYDGAKWKVSLYGIEGRSPDLSLIAVKHGGGGHRNACGFTCEELPFSALKGRL